MQLGVSLLKTVEFLEEQWVGEAVGKQVKNPQNILLSLALYQSPFLIIFSLLKGAAVGEKVWW